MYLLTQQVLALLVHIALSTMIPVRMDFILPEPMFARQLTNQIVLLREMLAAKWFAQDVWMDTRLIKLTIVLPLESSQVNLTARELLLKDPPTPVQNVPTAITLTQTTPAHQSLINI